jgi:TPR repeat protein
MKPPNSTPKRSSLSQNFDKADSSRQLADAQRALYSGDPQAARKIWQPLADQGDAEAQCKLGDLHQWGRGVTQDLAEAARWYRKAADQGNGEAQFRLGAAYYTGGGVTLDYAEAAKWLRKAADQDNSQAQRFLGSLYEKGLGVPQDYVHAYMWYSVAAGVNPNKHTTLHNEAFVAKMTPKQISNARRQAAARLLKSGVRSVAKKFHGGL